MWSYGTDPRRGTALVCVIILMVTMAALSLALASAGLVNSKNLSLYEHRFQAEALADAAVAHSLYELNRGEDLDGVEGVGNVAGFVEMGQWRAEAVDLGQATYRIRATGLVQGIVRTVEVTVHKTEARFPDALTATEEMEIEDGSLIDSYDSRLGSYESQAVHSDEYGAYAGTAARVYGDDKVKADGCTIRGDVHGGPDADLDISSSYVSGDVRSLSTPPLAMLPVYEEFLEAFEENANDTDWDELANINYDEKRMKLKLTNGASLTLSAGTYFFTEVALLNDSELRTDGEVVIYITDGMDAKAGSFHNPDGTPSALAVIAHPHRLPGMPKPPRTPHIIFRGGSGANLTVYAPLCDVEVAKGGEICGSVVGRKVKLDTLLHYDLALGAGGGTKATLRTFEQVSWRSDSTLLD